jgi:hypothetical protein
MPYAGSLGAWIGAASPGPGRRASSFSRSCGRGRRALAGSATAGLLGGARRGEAARGKVIGAAAVTDDVVLEFAPHMRDQELSLREIAARLVITSSKKKGRHVTLG